MVVLRGITWDHPRGFESIVAASAGWIERNPGTEVTWEKRSLQAFADASIASLAAEYDLLVIDHPHIPIAGAQDLLLDFEQAGRPVDLAALSAHSVGPSHDSYRWQGRQLALAVDAAAQVSVSRPDRIEAVPTTWPEVCDLGRDGRVIWPCKPVDAMSTYLTLMAGAGHPLVAGKQPDHDASISVLETLRELASLVPSACLDENPIQTAERLSTSDEWDYCPFAYGYVNYSRPGYRPHRLQFADIPEVFGAGGSCLGGAGLAVSAQSSHQFEAADLAFWCCSDEVQRTAYYRGGGQPGYSGAWDDPVVNADCLDFFSRTRQTLELSYVRPAVTGWMPAQQKIGQVTNSFLRGDMPLAACASAISEATERLSADGADVTRAQ